MTAAASCVTDGHEQVPAVAVLVYYGQCAIVGEPLCQDFTACRASDCGQLGDVYDADQRAAYCQRPAEQFQAGEAPHGPDIVEPGSARHPELLADPDTRTA
ncbi:hypothetical protein GA0070624_3183 [Micromonospora rhizosphaerae]|uniref:Uncharacterized protein n=1 Tax=Micromonospora rhizosphaerae TaxID=568872 RepID=A0A1C6S8L7_9ACTN|nr:hypothetical protein [Micromonospora rhizosphaerae]SCL25816.1 hypothetical protein GA0070624_3183 [Micromonospora rhizosphaerae]